jgi:hypothetical protein
MFAQLVLLLTCCAFLETFLRDLKSAWRDLKKRIKNAEFHANLKSF